jgi:hypothetical protein
MPQAGIERAFGAFEQRQRRKQIPPLRYGMTNKKNRQRQGQRQKQIPPLRYGMTNKKNRQRQGQRQKQIPPLRYGMTNKKNRQRQGQRPIRRFWLRQNDDSWGLRQNDDRNDEVYCDGGALRSG